MFAVQAVEDDGLVHAVEELRPEFPPQRVQHVGLHAAVRFGVGPAPVAEDELAADVGRHDHDRVLEIDGSPVAVGQPPVVQNLEQDVEHVGMGFFDFVEQDDGVRLAPDRLGQLAALVVADVSRRGADQPRDRVLLHVLRHVETDHVRLVVEQACGQRTRQFGLADARRPQEDERTDRALRILEARARPDHGVGDRLHRLVLSDQPPVEHIAELEQLFAFPLQQLGDRNPGPARDDRGDVVLVHLFLEQTPGPRPIRQRGLLRGQIPFELGQRPVFEFGYPVEVVGAFGFFDVAPGRFDGFLEAAQFPDAALFGFPAHTERVGAGLDVGQFLFEFLQAELRAAVGLLAQGFALDFELHDPPRRLVQFRGHGVDLGAQPGRGFVHEVDGLVGQETVGDVAVRQDRGRDQRGVLDPHAVVDFVPFAQPAQNGDGVFHRRLIHADRLKAALQRAVLLHVPAILVQRGRTDAVQFAARQHGLQQIGGVHRPIRSARPDHGVQLVDEEDHLALGRLNFLEHGLEPLLEFAAEFRAGDQRAHVEHDDPTMPEALRHVAAHDTLGQPFDDRGLADARVADQHRIVLGPTGQDLNDAADLVVAPDDRVELALPRGLRQVASVALQGLVRGFGVAAGDPLAPAHLLQGAEHALAAEPGVAQHAPDRAVVVQQGQQQVLDADVLVLQVARLGIGPVEQARQARGDVELVGARGRPRHLR